MWNKIKALFGKKSVLDLDNDGKIESYKQEIEGVFSNFKRMHDKLEDVNTKLVSIVEEELNNENKARKRAEKANEEIQMNAKLQEKLKDFIK